ncbi:MAG TPA: hypothetical protein V6D15_00380 [Oculatellaceae cyanobacterium]|jgi:hypothetical protein
MKKLNNLRNSGAEKRLNFLGNNNSNYSQGDILGLFVLGSLGLHIVIFLILLLQYGAFSNLARKDPPSLVQLSDGETVAVTALGNKERTPQVVSYFVVKTMTAIMNWSGTITTTKAEKETTKPSVDPGINLNTKVGVKGRVTTSAWQAGFALSEDFRKEFLQKVAQLIPQGVFVGSTQVALVPLEVRPPQQIASGKWKVAMVANLMVFDKGSNLGEVIPFNKEIFVQAVEVPPFATNGVAALIHKVRSSGLEIYGIRDLKQENM